MEQGFDNLPGILVRQVPIFDCACLKRFRQGFYALASQEFDLLKSDGVKGFLP